MDDPRRRAPGRRMPLCCLVMSNLLWSVVFRRPHGAENVELDCRLHPTPRILVYTERRCQESISSCRSRPYNDEIAGLHVYQVTLLALVVYASQSASETLTPEIETLTSQGETLTLRGETFAPEIETLHPERGASPLWREAIFPARGTIALPTDAIAPATDVIAVPRDAAPLATATSFPGRAAAGPGTAAAPLPGTVAALPGRRATVERAMAALAGTAVALARATAYVAGVVVAQEKASRPEPGPVVALPRVGLLLSGLVPAVTGTKPDEKPSNKFPATCVLED